MLQQQHSHCHHASEEDELAAVGFLEEELPFPIAPQLFAKNTHHCHGIN